MMRAALTVVVFAGCASGRASLDEPDASGGGGEINDAAVDAKVMVDAKVVIADAQMVIAIDAPPPPLDAYVCTVQTRQLLLNPVLDLTPSGMGWIAQNIDNAFPIITGDDGIAEHTVPFKAWMGGFTGQDKGVSSVNDSLYQDITIPAGTTQLVLTGQYEVRTSETGTIAYDTAQVALTQTNGTPIEVAKNLNNLTPTTSWTAFNKSFATAGLSGQTVRLRITTSHDVIDVTSFYFDTLALTVTYCQ